MKFREICGKIRQLESFQEVEECRVISLMAEAMRGAKISFFENEDGDYVGEFSDILNSSLAEIWMPECHDLIPSSGIISTIGFYAEKGRIFLSLCGTRMLEDIVSQYGIEVSAPLILEKLGSERNSILKRIQEAKNAVCVLKGELYEIDSWIAVLSRTSSSSGVVAHP